MNRCPFYGILEFKWSTLPSTPPLLKAGYSDNLFIYLRNVTFQFGTFKVKNYKLIKLIIKKKMLHIIIKEKNTNSFS